MWRRSFSRCVKEKESEGESRIYFLGTHERICINTHVLLSDCVCELTGQYNYQTNWGNFPQVNTPERGEGDHNGWAMVKLKELDYKCFKRVRGNEGLKEDFRLTFSHSPNLKHTDPPLFSKASDWTGSGYSHDESIISPLLRNMWRDAKGSTIFARVC